MRMKHLLPLLAAATFSTSAAAHATSVDLFTITDNSNGSTYLTFELPSSPGTSGANISYTSVEEFLIDNVSTSAGSTQVQFFDLANGGGLEIGSFGPTGAQLFSGTDDDPTFTLGSFSLEQNTPNDYTLVVSAEAPEPSSLMLLGTGCLAACGAIRRRIQR